MPKTKVTNTERAREIAGFCREVDRMALDHGEIVDDCLTQLQSKPTALCGTCSNTEDITAALNAAEVRSQAVEWRRWVTEIKETIGIFQTAPGMTQTTRDMYQGSINTLENLLEQMRKDPEDGNG